MTFRPMHHVARLYPRQCRERRHGRSPHLRAGLPNPYGVPYVTTSGRTFEIVIKADGGAICIDAPDCRVRICGIRGQVFVTDKRVIE